MSNGGGRVSIPRSMRKTIENIKEIAGSHADEEIYLMLKECNMDPNETAQKLLFQDTFHEVKRKRDRKKENVKESAEPRGKPDTQMNRGGRGNYTARYSTDDAGGGRNSVRVRENGASQVPVDGVGISTFSTSQDIKSKEASNPSSSTIIIDASVGLSSKHTSFMHASQSVTAASDITKLDDPLLHKSTADANKTVTEGTHVQLMPSPSNESTSGTLVPSSGVHLSLSESVLVAAQDSHLLGVMGTIDTGNQKAISHLIPVTPAESKPIRVSSEIGSFSMQVTVPNMSQVTCKDQLAESSQVVTSSRTGPPISRPLSSYGGRSQVVIGPQKVVGPNKEWKAKPTNPNLAEGPDTDFPLEVPTVMVEAVNHSLPAVSVIDGKQTSSQLEKKLQESHISDSQHVIIPNHFHVPEVEKLGFCFGSFDTNFGLNTSYSFHPDKRKSTSLSETSDDIEENQEGTSNQNELVNIKEDYAPSSSHVPESLISCSDDVSSVVIPEYSESKQENTDLSPRSQQYSAIHTIPSYNLGIMPPVVGSLVPPVNSTESQIRDVSLPPSYVVQQPSDPTSYYPQIYLSSADSDGRISPFHAPVISTKFSGNMTVLPPQASQCSSQEGCNDLILPTAGPTPLETQAAGAMQSSIAVTQQPFPVFRQPVGMHLPHYANYIPYHYYPIYVPPPPIHQYLSNGAFPPPQPQAGSVYPAPPVSTNKYSLPQYKPGNNTGNSNHMGMSDGYGPYGSSPAGFNPSSTMTTGHSTSSEDFVANQLKENNLFIAGKQSEGPAVWIPAPGRDISSLQASSFYNFPQAQMAFTATQANHGSFTGMYHPTQPVTGAAFHPLLQQTQTMAGPTASLYQPSQPTPINWTNNY